MHPKVEKIVNRANASFLSRKFSTNNFSFSWHYHQEYELTAILKSSGKRFVGNSIEYYTVKDFVLVGPNIPHTWYSEPMESKTIKYCEAIVIQFDSSSIFGNILELPEMKSIATLLENAKRGVVFSEICFDKNIDALKFILNSGTENRLVCLMKLLHSLATDPDQRTIAKEIFQGQLNEKQQTRLDTIFKFVHDNFKDNISQRDAAQKLYMSESAFSHFFKKSTTMTFMDYVNEFRINQACKLLQNTDLQIIAIAHQSGFSNLSYFNRKFLQFMKTTPLKYRKTY